MLNEFLIAEYSEGRDEAIAECVKTDSVEPFKEFINVWAKKGWFPECFELPNDEVLAISVRQMALHCTRIEPEIKGLAVNWLTEHGHHLDYTD